MGIGSAVVQYGKARLMRRVLGRVLGGNVATAMVAAWLGKKAFNYYRDHRRPAVRHHA